MSSATKRLQLDTALDFLRQGDALVVTKLDRLARSTRHLGEIVETIKSTNADLRILNLNIDTGSSTVKLVLDVMGSIAEFERNMMLERQKEGIASAKAEGRYKGRKPTARAIADQVHKLRKAGIKPNEIVDQLGISRASVYRILNEQGP